MKKTTDGDLSWITQPIPPEGGIIKTSGIEIFSMVNKDILRELVGI